MGGGEGVLNEDAMSFGGVISLVWVQEAPGTADR